ncbi:hypothetical protein BRADI_3g53950v3 [Brachypodium distachyon]|nr:hypothetical protein BRADI_3g53950v3 [Brachypodium distachyon]KQK01120.1 hypothetical protein BRADI_3g53950v3 [Brachypodium distachyon]
MTRMPPAVAASSDAKERVNSTSSCQSTPDACFSTQSAASRATATRSRTPHEATRSAWKPLTQPAVPSEELKRANIPTTNPTAKRSRVASSQAAKDSALKANRNVCSGKKNRTEESPSQGDHLDGAVIPSPPKKLQSGKSSSDVVSKGRPTTRNQGAKSAAPLYVGKPKTELGKDSASVLANGSPAGTDDVSQSIAPLLAHQLQLETAKDSNITTEAVGSGISQVNQPVAPVITEAIAGGTRQVNQLVAPAITEAVGKGTSQVNQLVAPVITLPRQQVQTDNRQKFTKIPVSTSQVSGLAGAPGPMVTPKLQIGNVKDSSNVLSNPAYTRALLIKQQEQLLQQYKLANSQPGLHIKGPALFEDDDASVPAPAIEPLGTRCALCKLDVAFQPQGGAVHDASAPPVVAVLVCHHTFHSSCIEAVYGLAEPSQCIACLDSATAH